MKKEQIKKADGRLADLARETQETVQKVLTGLSSIRLQIAEKKSECSRLEHLPISAEEAIQIIGQRIDDSASKFDDYLPALIHDSYPLIVDSLDGMQTMTAAFVCGVLGPEIKKNIATKIRESWPKETITAAERQTRLAVLAAEIHELETAEESICCQLEEFGAKVDRRPDLSPEVFLEVLEADEKV